MSEKEHQPPANGVSRSYDTEAAAPAASKEQKKKKRLRCLLYVVIFAVFQTGIILVFALLVMKFRTPQLRIQSARIESFRSSNSAGSFNMSIDPRLSVKNTNFGRFRYRNSTIRFFYRDTAVGEAAIPRGQAGFRSTRRFNVAVDLSAAGNSELRSELNSGVLLLTSRAELTGKVEQFYLSFFRKNKSIKMDCSMEIVIATTTVRNIMCRG